MFEGYRMPAFMTHPSVRIKGTENNYEPALCEHTNCSKHQDHSSHLHCPFCVKTEIFLDPVILRAHYRVKHVDKGLDFAGLKILRCCDQCEVLGSIKGEKKFKVPHWHCYRCRNGFNRRDEAIKHFRTHFKNPQTTFQIQVVQEVNVMLNHFESPEEMVAFVDEVSQEIRYDANSPLDEQSLCDEVVETRPNHLLVETERLQSDSKEQIICDSEPNYNELLEQRVQLEQHIVTLESNIKHMGGIAAENAMLKTENESLRNKVSSLSTELEKFRNSSEVIHSESVDRLIDELQHKHKELLHKQLLLIRSEGIMPIAQRDILTNSFTSHNHDIVVQEPPSKLSKI